MVISDKNIRINVTISKDSHQWLKNKAIEEERNVSNLINVIVKKYIEQEKRTDHEK